MPGFSSARASQAAASRSDNVPEAIRQCGNCGFADRSVQRCYSCATMVCSQCMAPHEEFCRGCLETFPSCLETFDKQEAVLNDVKEELKNSFTARHRAHCHSVDWRFDAQKNSWWLEVVLNNGLQASSLGNLKKLAKDSLEELANIAVPNIRQAHEKFGLKVRLDVATLPDGVVKNENYWDGCCQKDARCKCYHPKAQGTTCWWYQYGKPPLQSGVLKLQVVVKDGES